VVLVEEFVDGDEFSVNAYTKAGVTPCSASPSGSSRNTRASGITFANGTVGLDPDSRGAGARAALPAFARSVTTTAHVHPARLGSKGARIVETGVPPGGGSIRTSRCSRRASRFSEDLGVALGDEAWETSGPEARAPRRRHRQILIGRPGKVTRVSGLDAARALPGVVGAEVYVGVGGTVFPLTDARSASVTCCRRDDRIQADERAALAASMNASKRRDDGDRAPRSCRW